MTLTLFVLLSFDICTDGDMVRIGELNTAMNTFNVSDTIRWAGTYALFEQPVYQL